MSETAFRAAIARLYGLYHDELAAHKRQGRRYGIEHFTDAVADALGAHDVGLVVAECPVPCPRFETPMGDWGEM